MTSHRLDCLKLCLDMMVQSGTLNLFDQGVFLLNGVAGKHLDYVNTFIQSHPEIPWDTVPGPRGRHERISSLENQCVERYPEAVYVKLDEDVFVSEGWAESILATYERHRHDDNLALVTTCMPNSAVALYYLLKEFYPEKWDEYTSRFGQEPSLEFNGLTWKNAHVAEWSARYFIDLKAANKRHQDVVKESHKETDIKFSNRFSICCVCWDYRHWQKMGGIPKKDEVEWCDWIVQNKQFNVMDTSRVILHYSFFVQQDWLDRTHLLEDIRHINLPDSLSSTSGPAYYLPWLKRLACQTPRAIKRKVTHLFKRSS